MKGSEKDRNTREACYVIGCFVFLNTNVLIICLRLKKLRLAASRAGKEAGVGCA